MDDTKIGPWKRVDCRSLNELCTEALRLEDPPPAQPRGLLDALAGPLRFTTFCAALKALHGHPIYCWLKQHLPTVLEVAHSAPDEIWLVQRLVRYMVIGWGMEGERQTLRRCPARRDKRAAAAYRLIERLEKAIAEGTVWTPRLDSLEDLLAEAKAKLARTAVPRTRHMALQALAHLLYQRFKIAQASIILAIGAAMDLECDERTALRYVKKAREG